MAQPTPTPAPTPTTPTTLPPTDPATTPATDPAATDPAATATTPATTAPSAGVEAHTEPSHESRGPLGTAFGVGVHAFLTGPYGPSIVYNMKRFHIEGIIAFANSGGTDLALGGKFWFHAHQTRSSTLSLGGGAAFVSMETGVIDPRTGMPGKSTDLHLEGGAQIRFFATDNVSLSAAVGLAIVTGDGDFVGLTGQLTGGVGLTYFIF